MNEDKIFRNIERLRNPKRLAILETERVVSLCLQGPKIEKVLDIGTGSGVFAEVFTRRCLNVTGIDLQEPMLEAERPLLTLQEARRVCAVRTAVLEWPYVEQEFGPPLKDRLKSNEVLRMGNSSGFFETRMIPLKHSVLFLLEKNNIPIPTSLD
jgi:hypothetical protein